jgi:hypothetical protein
VTMICPALVRTGMSADGEDPADVAAAALAAVVAGMFAVVPGEWRGEVRRRAQRLVAGAQPAKPVPDQSPLGQSG